MQEVEPRAGGGAKSRKAGSGAKCRDAGGRARKNRKNRSKAEPKGAEPQSKATDAELREKQNVSNRTQVAVFVLSGLTDDDKLKTVLFILFVFIYLVTIFSNLALVAIFYNASNLQNPMYYFLSYLSLVDIFYSSTITPKMLSDLISLKKTISFEGCALQFFFLAGLATIEAFLLSTLSYDRYVAICHPLHYVSIMTRMKCLCLVLLSISFGFLQSCIQTSCVFSLQFYGSYQIDHFYCDAPLILRLSYSETSTCDIVTFIIVSALGMGILMTIFLSYYLVIRSILRIPSAEGKKKAFSTCSSHLICVVMYFGTIFFTYLHSPSSVLSIQDKVASIFYTAVIPMLNPFIYSLRNQDVKRTIISSVQKLLAKCIKCS
ncbi:olfactory receptor 5B21-like [Ranitomeya imitator]|uniref:olfactory receptor 5B21-like n=1 Tax=Ranitomeya imitator TaxID=111125 RepID=UPI0037E8C43E